MSTSWAKASDGAQAVRLVLASQPDVALMDVRMPALVADWVTRLIYG